MNLSEGYRKRLLELSGVNQNVNSKGQEIIDDILGVFTINEGINFSETLKNIGDYANKGLINNAMLTSLLNNDNFNQEQKEQIKDVINTWKYRNYSFSSSFFR
tara:strand:- start:15554 stop:15862 length:309 start_codon:yes stop_codon:yes gene_type:complete